MIVNFENHESFHVGLLLRAMCIQLVMYRADDGKKMLCS
jgi:hypothetical protein